MTRSVTMVVKKPKPERMVCDSFHLPPAMQEQVRRAAGRLDISKGEFIRRAIQEKLDREKKGKTCG